MNDFKGLYVSVSQNGDKIKNLDHALKKLKNIIKDTGMLLILQEKSHYMKPSERRRDAKNKAKSRYKNRVKS